MTLKDYSEIREVADLIVNLRTGVPRTMPERKQEAPQIAVLPSLLPLADIVDSLLALGRTRVDAPRVNPEDEIMRRLTRFAEENGLLTLLLVDERGFPVVEINPLIRVDALAAFAAQFGPHLERIDDLLMTEAREPLMIAVEEEKTLCLGTIVLTDRILFIVVLVEQTAEIDGVFHELRDVVVSLFS